MVKRITPATVNLSPALNNGGIVSMVTLIAKKVEPLISHRAIRINHNFERFSSVRGRGCTPKHYW
jgi:hypothetical protein